MVRSSGSTRREFARQTLAGLGLGFAAGLRIPSAASFEPAGRGGPVAARVDGPALELANDVIAARWSCGPEGLRLENLEDRRNRRALRVGRGTFALALDGGVLLDSAALRVVEPPRAEEILPDPRATRASEKIPGRRLTVALADAENRVAVRWRATLREGSHYVRQEVSVTARGADVPLREIVLVDLEAPGAGVAGTVAGSPIVAGFLVLRGRAPAVAVGRRPARAGEPVAGAAAQGRTDRRRVGGLRRRAGRAAAPRLPRVSRARARAAVRAVSPLQLLVRPRLLHAVRRDRSARRHRCVRPRAPREARRRPRLFSLRRRLGRPPPLGLPRRIPPRVRAAARRGRPLRRGAGRLALAVGRLREAAGGAARVREGAGLRDERGRPRALGSGLLQALPRGLPRLRPPLRRQSIQDRRHRQLVARRAGQRLRQRLRGRDRAHRGPARREARAVREPHDGHLSVAVLALLRRFDLARRRGPRLRRRGLGPAALDHVPRRRHVRRRRAARAAPSAQLAHAPRAHLREAREAPGLRSTRRLRRGDPLVLRDRNAAAGDVRDARAPRRSLSGTRSRKLRSGRAPTRRRSSTRTGSAAIPRGSSLTGGRPGRAAGRS